MYNKKYFEQIIIEIKNEGLYKEERIITSKQDTVISTNQNNNLLNFCSNNYLGLASDKRIIKAAKDSFDKYGYGLSSVRFICGTQTIHKELEKAVSEFLFKEDTILYSSCFDANGGLFHTILGSEDAIISDELNHASIIDGIRLCKAKVFRYSNNNMEDLENKLKDADANGARQKLIITDGVFSMDGVIANLKDICNLSEKYNALVVVDDSHGIGVIGEKGRGSMEHCGVIDRIDLVTGTFGKGLGGANGGFISGKKEIIALLRQRSRPYLFSNTLAPSICAASIKALEILSKEVSFTNKLKDNSLYFRNEMINNGFTLIGLDHPIIPVMLYDAKTSQKMAEKMLEKGIYVTSFSYPVVPKEKARIRVQISASHNKEDLNKCIKAFTDLKELLL